MIAHYFNTDLMAVSLSDAFVVEADAAYPDRRCTRNPKWVKELHEPLNKLAIDAYKAGSDAASVNSLADLRPYL